MTMKYAVDKKTGSKHSFEKGSSFDKERTKSDRYRVFSDDKKASEYARKVSRH